MQCTRFDWLLSVLCCVTLGCQDAGGGSETEDDTADLNPAVELGGDPADLAQTPVDAAGTSSLDMDCGVKPCLPPSLFGKTLTGNGTWRGSDVFSYSCVPGTPGRDDNGCCTAASAIGGRPSTIDIQIAPGMDGQPELRVSNYSMDGFGTHPTMQQGGRLPDGSFQSQPFFLRSTFAFTIEGFLRATWVMPKLQLRYSGSGTGRVGSGRCSEDTINIQATWEVDPGM